MAEKSKLLRALQRIAATARKIEPNSRPTPAIRPAPSVLVSLPEHKSLLPLLLSHDVPPRLAKACADRYDEYAGQLRLEAESELAPYLANRRKNQPAKVYTIFLNNYNQTLHRWSQSVLNTALKSLKRGSVELLDWEVTHPAPLWLPPADLAFARRALEENCPISAITRPAHAFPTTYPPPLRPPSGLFPVEWFRIPETPPTPSPISAVDLDSLCNRFATSLIIDENPRQPRQPKPSLFSLPIVTKEEPSSGHFRPKPPKRKHPRADAPRKPAIAALCIPPLGFTKPRRLSVPPFPSPSTKPKSTPRKTSTPNRISMPQQAPAPQRSGSTPNTPSTNPVLLNIPIVGGLDTQSSPGPSTPPLSPQSSLSLNFGWPAYSLAGPTTPPTLPPDLFSEPIVVHSTPVHLSPGSSLIPITDPFLQFQPQYDYFLDPSLITPLNYGVSTPGHATDSFFSKSAFDTPLGYDHFSYDIPPQTTSNPFELNFFNGYAAS